MSSSMERNTRFVIVEFAYGKQFKIAMELSSLQVLSGIEGPPTYSFLADTYYPVVGSNHRRINNFATYKDAVEAYKELVGG